MLNNMDFELWCRRLNLTDESIALISKIRNSEPVRSVGGGGGRNVAGRFPSVKMGRTIQFESHTCELPFILLCEFPKIDDIFEYWDQPIKLPITYKNKGGRTIRTNIFPDFFVIHEGIAEFVECKTEESLVKLAVDQPNKFCLDADGHWRCPPGEEAASKYGIKYRVFSTAEIDRTFVRNIVFLEDFLRYDVPELLNTVSDPIIQIVSHNESIRLSTLLERVEEIGATADAVYQLIATGRLYVDLSQEALVNRDRVYVYSSKPAATAMKEVISFPKSQFVEINVGALIQWGNNSFEIANMDHNNVWLIGEMGNHPLYLEIILKT